MIFADDAAFDALARTISLRAGLTLEVYKPKCLRRRIAVRMRACGVHTYGDYQALLDRNPGELELLKDTLTINVTRFYRNPETWNRVRAVVVPALFRARQGRVRVWSAGCASGEEPYTIAMLFADAADGSGRSGWFERLAIDATDIDRESLDRARLARYRLEAFSETPAELVERYTVAAAAETREVVERLRARVEVGYLDLSKNKPPYPAYDLVCCRNVVIYFERPMQERVFSLFVDALVPGGYLVLGKVETLFGAARERLELIDARERIYRRAA